MSVVRILRQVAEEEGVDLSGVEVGVMVEVPPAAIGISRLAAQADFLSMGRTTCSSTCSRPPG